MSSADLFSYVSGGIALLALVWSILRTFLPTRKMKLLEELMLDTEEVLQKTKEEGLLPESHDSDKFNILLSEHRERIEDFKLRIRCITGISDELWELFRGLSSTISFTTREVKLVRVKIITVSEAERRKREAIHEQSSRTCRHPSTVSSRNVTTTTDHSRHSLIEDIAITWMDDSGRISLMSSSPTATLVDLPSTNLEASNSISLPRLHVSSRPTSTSHSKDGGDSLLSRLVSYIKCQLSGERQVISDPQVLRPLLSPERPNIALPKTCRLVTKESVAVPHTYTQANASL